MAQLQISNPLSDIDVVILCGGLNTRLRPVLSSVPKVLAPVNGKPFLDLLLRQLVEQGFRRVILCVGHLRDQVIAYCDSVSHKCSFAYAKEAAPLGTGGALKNAQAFIKSEHFLAMNGDGYCPVDFQKLHDFHIDREALFSMVVAPNRARQDAGSVLLGSDGKLVEFAEKNDSPSPYISAGIYMVHQNIFNYMPPQKTFSLEKDLFPRLIGERFYGFPVKNEVFDIGTPERYQKANEFFRNLKT